VSEGLAAQLVYGEGKGQNTLHHYAGASKSKTLVKKKKHTKKRKYSK
jgi:hypothetical protein